MFGGVIETTEGLQYNIDTDRDGELIPWTVAGPTCDSVDVVMREELLPEDLQEDDFIYIKNAAPTPPPTRATSTAFRCRRCASSSANSPWRSHESLRAGYD